MCGRLLLREGRRYRHGRCLRRGSRLRISRIDSCGVRNGWTHIVSWSSRRRCRRCAASGGLRGAGLPVIHGDHARVDVADFAVFRLDARKNKAVEKDGEALAACNGSDSVRRLPRLGENLRALGMRRAVDVPQFVGPSGRNHEKRDCEQNEKTCASHRPLLGPGTRRALKIILRGKTEG